MIRTRLVLTLAAIAAISPVYAAGAQAAEPTLIGSRITNGGYGAPVQRLSVISGNSVLFTGVEGGWIVDHHFVLGGAGYGLATQNVRNAGSPLRDSKGRTPVVEMGYGGVTLGYVAQPTKLVHLSIQTLVGGGGITYDVTDISGVRPEDAPNDAFFVAEPSVQAELNVTSFFRIALGGGYRFVSGARLDGLRDASLSGGSASLAFKFGRF